MMTQCRKQKFTSNEMNGTKYASGTNYNYILRGVSQIGQISVPTYLGRPPGIWRPGAAAPPAPLG